MYLLKKLLKKEYFKWNDFTELVICLSSDLVRSDRVRNDRVRSDWVWNNRVRNDR